MSHGFFIFAVHRRSPDRTFGSSVYSSPAPQPSGPGYSPAQPSPDDASFYQPLFTEESPKSDDFNKPLSRRLRRKDDFGGEFSSDAELHFGAPSEFARDDQLSPDMGFRTPRTLPEKDEDAPPRKVTSYEELRMKNRGGSKF